MYPAILMPLGPSRSVPETHRSEALMLPSKAFVGRAIIFHRHVRPRSLVAFQHSQEDASLAISTRPTCFIRFNAGSLLCPKLIRFAANARRHIALGRYVLTHRSNRFTASDNAACRWPPELAISKKMPVDFAAQLSAPALPAAATASTVER